MSSGNDKCIYIILFGVFNVFLYTLMNTYTIAQVRYKSLLTCTCMQV